MRKRVGTGRMVAYAVLGLIVLYNITPFLWMLFSSFKTDAEAYANPPTIWPEAPALDAYVQVLRYGNFVRYFVNSTIVSLGAALLSTALGALAGYGFARFSFRGRAVTIGAILASQMLPGVLLVGPYFKVLSNVGLYNSYVGLILAFTTITLPFSTWMLKQYIDTVPREFDDAAKVDGCSPLQAFLRVVLPLALPGAVATFIFAFLLAWGDLLWALVLVGDQSLATITLGLSRLVTQFRILWPQLMAGSVVAAVPCVVLYLIIQRYIVEGLAAGGVRE
jgi:multiple sugar transport system permease protein